MSTGSQPGYGSTGYIPSDPGAAPPAGTARTIDNITVIGHSNLLYWWPVWAVCFALALWTYMEGYQMAAVPPESTVVRQARIPGYSEPRDAIVAPPGKTFSLAPAETRDAEGNVVAASRETSPSLSRMTVASSNSLGVIFALTLLVVALVSTVTFRGLVSLVVIIGMIALVVTLALLDMWDEILLFFGGLDIRMNAAGYLFVGIPILLAWMFVVFIYDRQVYMVVDEGQIRYVMDVGDSAMVVPAEGATVEKKRNDVFRHWLLGFGTGDIVIRTGSGERIELENVVNANRKLVIINDMLRHKPVMIETA